MNTSFSFNRLGLLLKRFFIENKQKELISWGVLTMVFIVLHNSGVAVLILYVGGLIFAANQFNVFSNTPSGMHYLLIPATHSEKLSSSILLSTVYFFTMTIITYCIGNIIGTHVYNLIFSTNDPINWELFGLQRSNQMVAMINTSKNQFWEMTSTFLQIQALFIVGSLYFKRNAIGKTLLTIAVLWLLLVAYQLFLMTTLWGGIEAGGNAISMNLTLNKFAFNDTMKYLLYTFTYLVIPFLWLVSYFRLKEKQV